MTYSDSVAQYLSENPDFFDRHPELLAAMTLAHPHSGQAISLAERQALLLRERVKALETRLSELLRNAEANGAIADKLSRWTRALLAQSDPARLPATLVDELKDTFLIPYSALRLWNVKPEFVDLPCARGVGADTISLTSSMGKPYCGANAGFEAASWLAAGDQVKSIALLPLRAGGETAAFGLLVLGSDEAERFEPSMGTAFLERIADLAGAALARLRH
jgi:uncharacterized protein YigA (DUF484 family)